MRSTLARIFAMCCTTWVWFLDSGQPNSHSTRLSGLLGTWNCAGQFHKTCSFEPCWWWQNGQRPFERPRVMTENLIGLTNAPVKQATSCMLPKDARNRVTRHRVASYSSWRKFWESRRFCCVKKVHCFLRQLSRRWWRISSQLATRCALLRSIATLRAAWCHRKGAWTTQSNFFRKSLTRRVTPPAKVQSRGRLRTRWMCLNNAETAFWPAMNSRSTWCPHNSLHRYTEACWWPYPALRVRDTNFVHHLTGGARRIQPKDALPVITWLANLCFPLELKGSARTRSADFTALSNLLTSLGLGAEPLLEKQTPSASKESLRKGPVRTCSASSDLPFCVLQKNWVLRQLSTNPSCKLCNDHPSQTCSNSLRFGQANDRSSMKMTCTDWGHCSWICLIAFFHSGLTQGTLCKKS